MSADAPRGRGPSMTREMKAEIRDLHLKHHDWPAKSFVEPLEEKFGWSPEERAIQKVRKLGMDKIKEEKVFGWLQPWNLGKIDSYPIPAEAIPYVLEVKKWTVKEFKGDSPLNVWQVRWIARLYTIGKYRKDPYALWKIATFYAIDELESIFADEPEFDTSKLDEMITSPTIVGARWDAFILDWDRRLTEYALSQTRFDAEMWILMPKIFFGLKTWEELKEKYSKKDGEK
ncbi:hypothetical protein ACFLXH_05225 [Chloroflexota bacterium]